MNTLSNIASLQGHFNAELLLSIGSIAIVLLSFKKGLDKTKIPFFVTLGFLVLALAAVFVTSVSTPQVLFEGMLASDPFGKFFKILILITAIFGVFLVEESYDLKGTKRVEFYAFYLALVLGLCVMSVSNDLLMIYLAVEMASIVSYILTGYITFNKRSEEAGLKYVFYGGMASGVMIFGLSLLYGLTGTLNLIEIREFFLNNATDRLVLFITFIFVLTGLGYKMAIAPFHMWSPDVYEGAPIAITAFLSVASKAAGFAMTVRFFHVAFIQVAENGAWLPLKALDWRFLVAVLSALTMCVGNLVALRQSNIKRFLAYSSVAHAGYLLMGLAVQSIIGIEGIIFYFMIYFLMNLGAFFVVVIISNQFGTENIEDYKGMIRREGGVFLTLFMGTFLLSLAGLPPFSGFIAKWYVFGAVIQSGTDLLWLAAIGVINSVISLYYYLRILKYMIIDEPVNSSAMARPALPLAMCAGVFAVLTLVFGIFFSPLAQIAKDSAKILY